MTRLIDKAVQMLRVLAPWVLGAMFSACGAESTQQAGPDSSSHWLGMCTNDDQCDAGQSCLCNRCTLGCSADDECKLVASDSPGAATAQCAEVTDCSAGPVCQLECSRDAECPSSAPHCVAARCEAVALPSDADSGASDAGPVLPAPECLAQVTYGAQPLSTPAPGNYTYFVNTDAGIVGIGAGAGPEPFFATLDTSGQTLASGVLWSDLSLNFPPIALGDSVALVAMGTESERTTCRIGIFDARDGSDMLAPVRYSNEPSADTILHEANWCWVTKTSNSFVAIAVEYSSDTSGEMRAFAQRFDRDGALQGASMELAVGEKEVTPGLVTTDGERAVVLMNKDGAPGLLLLDDTTEVQTIDIDPAVTQGALIIGIVAAHGRFLLRIGDGWVLIDETGKKVGGPAAQDTEYMAPLGDGYVALLNEEFLVARTLDANLQLVSEPTGIGLDRNQSYAQLVPMSADSVVVVYPQDGELAVATLACGDTPPSTPPGPAACEQVEALQALDDGCTEAVCHAVLRLDAKTLAFKGYAFMGGPALPVDAAQAQAVAMAGFAAEERYIGNPPDVSGPNAGFFAAYAEPLDFGGFALVSEQSGLLVAEGGIVFGGRGSLWIPESFREPSAVQCSSAGVMVAERASSGAGNLCEGEEGSLELPSVDAAIDMALRTNVALRFADQGSFSAYGYGYAPTAGACASEYLVLFTRQQ